MFDMMATNRYNDGGLVPFYPYTINQSCRFNDDDNAHLYKSTASSDNTRKWTLSFWIKRCNISTTLPVIQQYVDGNNFSMIYFANDDTISFYSIVGGVDYSREWVLKFRDIGSFYHIKIEADFIQADADDRLKLYVNETLITSYTSTYGIIPQNYDQFINSTSGTLYINTRGDVVQFGDSYLSELFLVDNDVSGVFGQSKSGIWIPAEYTGSYGTNGFHLDFANSADLGNDVSGNNNDFTSSGLAANDQVEDSPTNNYPTLNGLHHLSTATLANGNLDCSGTENEYATIIIPPSGKWGWEITVSENGSFGLEDIDTNEKVAADVSGEVVEMLVDMNLGTLKKKVDGGGLETIEASLDTDKEWYPYFKAACSVDFGQLGYSSSEVGYKSLCSKNLSNPTIKDSSTGFDVVLYEGTGAEQSITDLSFQPDLVWIKNRDAADEHKLIDSVRGATFELSSDHTGTETEDANGLTTFLSNGFTLGTGANGYNDNGESFVAWCFRMGAKYGFDIGMDEGTGVAHAINHNLGGVPELIFRKCLTRAVSWVTYHHHALNKTDPETDYGTLDTNALWLDSNLRWNDVAPTNTQFTVGTENSVNENTKDFVTQLWRSIPGFSKVFSYTGNGNADGPFVYCGFRPRYVLIKNTAAPQSWILLDTKRNTYNVVDNYLRADTAGVEDTVGENETDILSQGFKLRSIDAPVNTNGVLYVGIAYAEQSGKYSNSR